MTAHASPAFTHLTADFIGVPPAQLRDGALLNGLLIAAAGAAGLTTLGAPIVRQSAGHAIGELLLLDGCRISIHAIPDAQVLLLDIISLATHDVRKALDVFARRLSAREIRSEYRARG